MADANARKSLLHSSEKAYTDATSTSMWASVISLATSVVLLVLLIIVIMMIAGVCFVPSADPEERKKQYIVLGFTVVATLLSFIGTYLCYSAYRQTKVLG